MKIGYDRTDKQFYVAAYNPRTKHVEIVEKHPDFDYLGTKHGFLSLELESEEDKKSLSESEGILD